MNKRLVFKLTGFILILEGASMLLPLGVSILYGENDIVSFLLSSLLTGGAGALMYFLTRRETGNMYTREAFTVVGISWSLLALFGALPFFMSGAIPSFIDCIFESMSGLTTSGATILSDIEALPNGVLFWRSLTHWMGGMGVLILFIALLPSMGGRSQSLLKAEATGPTPGKIVPRISETVKILYGIYAAMTLIMIICLLIAGLPLFHAVTVAFSTAGTGGFAITNLSIGAYSSAAVDIIVSVFMLLFSVSFTVYHAAVARKWSYIKSNTELKWFGAIVGISIALIWINIGANLPLFEGFRQSFFQVSSIISSTGFATADYNRWPALSQFILVTLMITGSCGGSTAGGVKVARIAILFKSIHREIKKILHPRSTPIVRMNGKIAEDSVTSSVLLFFAAYIFVILGAALLLSLDNLDFTTTLTAAVAAVGNTGPGLNLVGPMGNFSVFSPLSKIVLSVCMLLGRLEIFPLLVILSPAAWGKK